MCTAFPAGALTWRAVLTIQKTRSISTQGRQGYGNRMFWVLQLPRADLLPPGAAGGAAIGIGFGGSFLEELDELDQDPLDVANDGHFRSADLADFGRVDIDVDDFGVRGEGGEASGDAIVEAHAERD